MANRIFSVGPSLTTAIPFLVDFKNGYFCFCVYEKMWGLGKCGNMVVFTATATSLLSNCFMQFFWAYLCSLHTNIWMEDVSALEMEVSIVLVVALSNETMLVTCVGVLKYTYTSQ